MSCQKADTNYFENANLILELSKRAAELFKKQKPEEKRKLAFLITSNCVIKDGKVDIELRSPFDMVMKTAKTRNWRPLLDAFLNRAIEFGFNLQSIQAAFSNLGIVPVHAY